LHIESHRLNAIIASEIFSPVLLKIKHTYTYGM
jgi:hypothetical protein